jgi:hypothetical protein
MVNNKNNRRNTKRNRQLAPIKVAAPLTKMTRRLVRQTSVLLESWQVNGGVQYSGDKQLDFAITDFPGFTSMAQISDHYRILNVTHRLTKHYRVGESTDTATTTPRTVTFLSSYDKDGGAMNPLDILSRSNLKISTFSMAQPTVVLSGRPAYRNSDGRVVENAILDAQGTQPTFHSFSIVGMANDIGVGTQIVLELISTIDVEFQGLR